MTFKFPYLRTQFWLLHPKAKTLLCFVDWVSEVSFKKPIFVTSIFHEGGTGVHAQYRAFDVRTVNYYTQEQLAYLCSYVNSAWTYDPNRLHLKTCIYHQDALPGEKPEFHLHFQVHPYPLEISFW